MGQLASSSKIITNSVFIPLVFQTKSQYTEIWYDTMESKQNDAWTPTPSESVEFGYSSEGCFNEGLCTRTMAGDGGDSFVLRTTDISGYSSLQLQYSVSMIELEVADTCKVFYGYDSTSAKTLVTTFNPPDEKRHFYPNQIHTLPSSISKSTVYIWLETDTGDNSGSDYCYWNHVYLRGIFGTIAPTQPTAPTAPTHKPTTSNPTPQPTYIPSQQPTLKPTRVPKGNNPSPTEPPTPSPTLTSTPTSVGATSNPTPNVVPTDTPTLVNTPEATDSSSSAPTPNDIPTDNPAQTPTDIPSDNPTIPPTDAPTPTDNPTIPPTDAPTANDISTDTSTDIPTRGPTEEEVGTTDDYNEEEQVGATDDDNDEEEDEDEEPSVVNRGDIVIDDDVMVVFVIIIIVIGCLGACLTYIICKIICKKREKKRKKSENMLVNELQGSASAASNDKGPGFDDTNVVSNINSNAIGSDIKSYVDGENVISEHDKMNGKSIEPKDDVGEGVIAVLPPDKQRESVIGAEGPQATMQMVDMKDNEDKEKKQVDDVSKSVACTDCGQVKEGKIFDGDGQFYCIECWSAYNEMIKEDDGDLELDDLFGSYENKEDPNAPFGKHVTPMGVEISQD